ncbi:MAG: S8 family serine peptidase [Lewinellaceae bacterium]|nr:S8 family serine peptidase [Lewinellaceae bacterium]
MLPLKDTTVSTMKKLLLLCCSFAFPLLLSAQTAADKIATSLWDRMISAPTEMQDALVILSAQEDMHSLLEKYETEHTPLEVRNVEVLTRLQNTAATSQPALLDKIRALNGIDKDAIQTAWIVNVIAVRADAYTLERIALLPEVGEIDWNGPVTQEMPTHREPAAISSPNGSEVGLRAIRANFLWNLGYTGYGRKVMIIDTGEDAEHPALAGNWWWHEAPKSQAWTGSAYPEDCSDHGSHVTGTTCGIDRKTNDTIGVAYNAHWIGAPLGNFNDCVPFNQTIMSSLVTLQFALNPDGNVQTLDDRPDAINCSFNSGDFGCNTSSTKAALNSLEAAGVAVVWSGGNTGPAAGTVASGASINTDVVNSFCVGAVNGANPNFPIADFSSRGPTPCGGSGSLLIKPEVSAPGVAVRSSTPNGTYQNFDGTSMAAPHTTGSIALLKEVFPTLSGTQIKLALYNSATDLGVAGEDNTYGMGMINLESAYNYLIAQGHVPVPPIAADRDVIMIKSEVKGVCKGPVEATVTFENAGTITLTSLHFDYGVEGGQVFGYDWTGSLAPNTFTTITLPGATGITPGTYDFIVHISNPNGVTDPRDLNNQYKVHFIMNDYDYPLASVSALQAQPVCKNSRVLLEYNSTPGAQSIVQWYSNPITAVVLAEGEQFLTPPLSANTTYYVNASESYSPGKSDLPAGNNGAGIGGALQFNATKAFLLRSVKVYADAPGARVIRLLDNTGALIATKNVSLSSAGEQRISLNFNVPIGNGMQLVLFAGNPLSHTTIQPGYPHTIPGVMSIYSGKTSAGSSTPFFYYYFFNWEIEVPLPCGRTAIPIEVSSMSAPTVGISAPDTIYLSQGGTGTFTYSTSGNTGSSRDFGNGTNSTDDVATATYTEVGNYTVTLMATTNSGCVSFGTKNIVVLAQPTSGVLTTDFDPGKVFLFPNPTTGEINLGFMDNQVPKTLDVQIVDMLGRMVHYSTEQASNTLELHYNVAGLPDGLYMVQIRHEGQLYWSGKFVKE